MISLKSHIRKWGRSLGVVIPKKFVVKEHIRPNETVEIFIRKRNNPMKETFGTLKFDKSTEEILRKSDKEAWDE